MLLFMLHFEVNGRLKIIAVRALGRRSLPEYAILTLSAHDAPGWHFTNAFYLPFLL